MRHNRQWTNQEDAELLTLKNSGLSVQRMAVRLKRTNRAVGVRLAMLRRRPLPLPKSGSASSSVSPIP